MKISATFFECGIRYERTAEDGTTKKVNELYIVDALTFGEAEARVTKEIQPFFSEVMTLKRTRYSEYDNGEGDKYYKAKIMLITIDEKTGKEKRNAIYWLVSADNIGEARKKVVEAFANTTLDYEIATLDETKYLDVFLRDTNHSAEKTD